MFDLLISLELALTLRKVSSRFGVLVFTRFGRLEKLPIGAFFAGIHIAFLKNAASEGPPRVLLLLFAKVLVYIPASDPVFCLAMRGGLSELVLAAH